MAGNRIDFRGNRMINIGWFVVGFCGIIAFLYIWCMYKEMKRIDKLQEARSRE